MPRKARKKSESGIYHIMMRGINRQSIFEDEDDYKRFIATIGKYKNKCGYEVFAYCLMGNHVHLLLKEGQESLEQIMRRICGSYVYWYNWKYQRIGNLFQDRFKSEVVENDAYFLIVQRYIHQNPIKAGLTKRIEQYKWSSFHEYVDKAEVIDSDFLLKMFHYDRKEAVREFIHYNKEVNNYMCLDMEEKKKIMDEEASDIIKKVCKVKYVGELQNLEKSTRNSYLKKLKEQHSLSIRQIERLTGINRGVIFKA